MEEYQSDESGTGCDTADLESGDDNLFNHKIAKRKNSFVWKYFRPVVGTKTYECIICNSCVGNQTSNLGRHLGSSHDITKQKECGYLENTARGRPSRSFIWKYCTKEDTKHARCHLCNKLLYFGGGNTANISKHLRRRHQNFIESKRTVMDEGTETKLATALINGGEIDTTPPSNIQDNSIERKERKGGSYVWNYCNKLSRHTIRCKLCNKIMSFHGTANVITHLQRKHNIMGKMDNNAQTTEDNNTAELNISEENSFVEDFHDTDSNGKRRRRSSASASIVWKYCTRISRDAVRCGFCKKNLSYQGTSNLQRHLHRMHGVATQGRVYKDSEKVDLHYKLLSSNFIWDHCTLIPDEKIKCNMCSSIFDCKDTGEISKHLTITHAIEPRRSGKRRKLGQDDTSEESSDEFEDFDENWSRNIESNNFQVLADSNIKKDESMFDDLIIEDPESKNFDEDPFDPNIMNEIALANPLSPQSSRGASPEMEHKVFFNKKLQKLNEERVRMETEYFREKAGFYRMQKYLTALQAKKVRVEIERINKSEYGSSTTQ